MAINRKGKAVLFAVLLAYALFMIFAIKSRGGEVISSNASSVLKTAESLVGYKEGGNNNTVMGKWYGLNNQPWCAMFVSWCFKEAGLEKLVAAQSKKGFASCAIGLTWFKQNKQIVSVKDAKPGDIVFFRFSGGNHVGIVAENHADKGYLVTIEGNTSPPKGTGSQRDGEGVYKKTRKVDSTIVAVARPRWPSMNKIVVASR
jgi:hypothetical protein